MPKPEACRAGVVFVIRHFGFLRHSSLVIHHFDRHPLAASYAPHPHVYLSTSSMVVSPAKMLRRPSWRSVIIPSSIAFCLIVTVGARSLINSCLGSLTFISW